MPDILKKLYSHLPVVLAEQRRVPDWSYIHEQLRRKSVTLMLFLREYEEQYPQFDTNPTYLNMSNYYNAVGEKFIFIW